MTYQAPAFMVAHPTSKLVLADITPFNASSISDDSKRAWIDSKQGELGSLTADSVFGGMAVDYSVSFADTINRCVIPNGHNLASRTMRLSSGTVLGSLTLLDSIVPSGGEILDFSFSSVSSHQFWNLLDQFSVNLDILSFSEFWIGNRKALNVNDARVATGFERSYEHDVTEAEFAGRTAVLELAPARRKFSLLIRDLDPSATDFATLDEVIRDGRANPFWYWTPDTTDTGPYLVKLTRSATREQRSSVPMKSVRYEVELEMLEQL